MRSGWLIWEEAWRMWRQRQGIKVFGRHVSVFGTMLRQRGCILPEVSAPRMGVRGSTLITIFPTRSPTMRHGASVAMVMWGFRMLQVSPDRRYGDVMERALYNGVLSGVSLAGTVSFIANHLASHPKCSRTGSSATRACSRSASAGLQCPAVP